MVKKINLFINDYLKIVIKKKKIFWKKEQTTY